MAVLALGIGLVFGLTLLAGWAMRETEATVVDEAPAEPVAAEPVGRARREAVRPRRRVLLVPVIARSRGWPPRRRPPSAAAGQPPKKTR